MKTVKDKVNALIKKHFIVMTEVKDNKLYHLVDHWKYLKWKKDSKRVLIGAHKAKDGFYYLTRQIK